MSMATDTGLLYGDWRRRRGTRTDAHYYPERELRPICGRRIEYGSTEPVPTGRPCYECLVADLTKRRHA